MTSPSPHLDLDGLADALADEGAATDADHLAGCADCASRLAELRAADTAVLGRLAGLGSPALPADVAARLDAALAAQDPLAGARTGSVTALPDRRTRALPGWLPAAAAAVLVLGGVGAAVSQSDAGLRGGTDAATSSAAGGSAETAETAETASAALLLTASGADWADPATPGTALPQVLGGQAQLVSLTEGDDAARTAQDPAPESQDADAPAPAAAPMPDELARLRTREGLDACLSPLLAEQGPGVQPLAVDYATYDGQPALAVVLPDPDPASAAVYVVGSDCSAADPDLLLFRRAPLP